METTSVPPLSETILVGKLQSSAEKWFGILEPNSNFMELHCLLIAPALISYGTKTVPIRLMNASEKTVVVYTSTSVGVCQPVNSVVCPVYIQDSSGGTCSKSNIDATDLPGHLQQLVEEVQQDITDSEVEEVETLLHRYTDIFSSDTTSPGHTGLVKHTIFSGDGAPIRQPAQR